MKPTKNVLGTSELIHHLASLSSHRSRPSSWSSPPLPPRPAPAPRSSCSSSATLPSWSAWGRSWEPGVSSTMAASAPKESWGLTPSWASSTWTVSSRRCWDSLHLSRGLTEPPCRPSNLTWVVVPDWMSLFVACIMHVSLQLLCLVLSNYYEKLPKKERLIGS